MQQPGLGLRGLGQGDDDFLSALTGGSGVNQDLLIAGIGVGLLAVLLMVGKKVGRKYRSSQKKRAVRRARIREAQTALEMAKLS